MQLIQNLTSTVQNLQAQQNQLPPQGPPPPPPIVNKHREFMSHHPPTYSHSVDPLDADDWLKTINKMLNITQCNDREKVLFASGRLEGAIVWTSLGPLSRWVPGPTTRWAPRTTRLVPHDTWRRGAQGLQWRSTRIGSYTYPVLCRELLDVPDLYSVLKPTCNPASRTM
jgi:hypothetical protein